MQNLCALLAVIDTFVALAMISRALDLSTPIGLLLTRIVVTNAIVLRDLAQHKIEAGADVRTALIQGGRIWKCPMLMTAAATILTLIPLLLSSSGLTAASLATGWGLRAHERSVSGRAHRTIWAGVAPRSPSRSC